MSAHCCALTPGARGVVECCVSRWVSSAPYGFEVHGAQGAVAWDFRRMGELRVCADQGYQDVAWQVRHVGPGQRRARRHSSPARGFRWVFDDLKVIEAERLVRSIAEGKPVGATIDDAVWAARLVEAMEQSAADRRWTTLAEPMETPSCTAAPQETPSQPQGDPR